MCSFQSGNCSKLERLSERELKRRHAVYTSTQIVMITLIALFFVVFYYVEGDEAIGFIATTGLLWSIYDLDRRKQQIRRELRDREEYV